MRGWVYILSNDSLPGLLKVGYTSKDPEGRAKELSGDTGVPTPFTVEYEILIEDAHRCERRAHAHLAKNRVNDRREFFRCSIDEAIEAVRTVAEGEIQYENRLRCAEEPAHDDYISFELIGLIRYLLEDGELADHEVYHLCEWLNNHPNAFDVWPGSELAKPLNEVYADGVLSVDELVSISQLLQRIDIEFTEKFEESEKPPVLEQENMLPPVIPPEIQEEDITPTREMAEERDGIFGGLLQKMEQMKLDRAWRNRVEEFEEQEKQRERQEYIEGIIQQVQERQHVFNPTGIIIKDSETVCWVEPAVLIEEVTRGSRGYRYKDNVAVDEGQFIFTTERFIFKGNAKTFDTRIDRILGVDIALDGFAYSIQNRTKKKCLEFPNGNGDIICAVLNHIGAS